MFTLPEVLFIISVSNLLFLAELCSIYIPTGGQIIAEINRLSSSAGSRLDRCQHCHDDRIHRTETKKVSLMMTSSYICCRFTLLVCSAVNLQSSSSSSLFLLWALGSIHTYTLPSPSMQPVRSLQILHRGEKNLSTSAFLGKKII